MNIKCVCGHIDELGNWRMKTDGLGKKTFIQCTEKLLLSKTQIIICPKCGTLRACILEEINDG